MVGTYSETVVGGVSSLNNILFGFSKSGQGSIKDPQLYFSRPYMRDNCDQFVFVNSGIKEKG